MKATVGESQRTKGGDEARDWNRWERNATLPKGEINCCGLNTDVPFYIHHTSYLVNLSVEFHYRPSRQFNFTD